MQWPSTWLHKWPKKKSDTFISGVHTGSGRCCRIFPTSGMCVMSPHVYNLCCFVVILVLSRFTHFCCKICFVAIYALLYEIFFYQKLPLWRKKDKYQVWWAGIFFWYSEAVACEIEYETGEMRPRQLHRESSRGRCEYYVKAEFWKLLSVALGKTWILK